MLNFEVPQFIEIEDKIFGPLSFRQFIYVVGGAGACFMFWVYLPYRWLAVILIIPTLGFALALAFYKVNNRSFILVLEAAFRYLLTHKLYLWKNQTGDENLGAKSKKELVVDQPRALVIPKLSDSRLKDLSWSLDVQEKIK